MFRHQAHRRLMPEQSEHGRAAPRAPLDRAYTVPFTIMLAAAWVRDCT